LTLIESLHLFRHTTRVFLKCDADLASHLGGVSDNTCLKISTLLAHPWDVATFFCNYLPSFVMHIRGTSVNESVTIRNEGVKCWHENRLFGFLIMGFLHGVFGRSSGGKVSVF
jgi:hypothetical protein